MSTDMPDAESRHDGKLAFVGRVGVRAGAVAVGRAIERPALLAVRSARAQTRPQPSDGGVSLPPVIVDSQSTLEAVLSALTADGWDDERSRDGRAPLERAPEESSVIVGVLPSDDHQSPASVAAPTAAPAIVQRAPEAVVFEDLVLHAGTREVSRGGRELRLTGTEFRLLELLLRHPGHILPRGLIFERVWGWDVAATSNLLNVYIGYLRRKTEAAGESRLIHTIRGIGYVLRR